jgi:enoyl-CoA hydratase
MKYCEALATRSRPGLAAMKRLARGALEHSLSEGLRVERVGVSQSMLGPDPAEGIAAFLERREPSFSG